jgi:hypothetical protein
MGIDRAEITCKWPILYVVAQAAAADRTQEVGGPNPPSSTRNSLQLSAFPLCRAAVRRELAAGSQLQVNNSAWKAPSEEEIMPSLSQRSGRTSAG